MSLEINNRICVEASYYQEEVWFHIKNMKRRDKTVSLLKKEMVKLLESRDDLKRLSKDAIKRSGPSSSCKSKKSSCSGGKKRPKKESAAEAYIHRNHKKTKKRCKNSKSKKDSGSEVSEDESMDEGGNSSGAESL